MPVLCSYPQLLPKLPANWQHDPFNFGERKPDTVANTYWIELFQAV